MPFLIMIALVVTSTKMAWDLYITAGKPGLFYLFQLELNRSVAGGESIDIKYPSLDLKKLQNYRKMVKFFLVCFMISIVARAVLTVL